MIKKLPKDFQIVIRENNGLQQYLSNLQKGRDFTPRSWLYEHMNANEVLQQWKNVLETLQTRSAFEQRVYEFDISSEEKWGPQGGIPPLKDLLEKVVLPTFADSSSNFSAFQERDWKHAVKIAIDTFQRYSLRGLRPATYSSVVNDMHDRSSLESNSGWPLFTRRSKPEVVKAAIAAAENGEWRTYPAISLFRNYRGKDRLVWMFAMATNLVEGSFCRPLQKGIMREMEIIDACNAYSQVTDFFAPWAGFDRVRKLITKAYSMPGAILAASDFSATDAHFKKEATAAVAQVIARCFQKPYQSAVVESLLHMHEIPLVISQDEWIVGDHGVSSGSEWTNFVETIFDFVFAIYVMLNLKRTQRFMVRGLYAIGDDMTWLMPKHDERFAQWLEELGKAVGQDINQDKTWNRPDEVKTLQRLFQRGYRRPDGYLRGVYPTIRALNSLIYPERFHNPKDWSSDMFCARTYMILENCVDHPLFEEFVKFVVAGQKDLIPFAQKSKADLDRITRETKSLPGLNPTYNTEKEGSSLANFEAVKFASSL